MSKKWKEYTCNHQ